MKRWGFVILMACALPTMGSARDYDLDARAAFAMARASSTPGPTVTVSAKECPCSEQCECGCEFGEQCDCKVVKKKAEKPAPVYRVIRSTAPCGTTYRPPVRVVRAPAYQPVYRAPAYYGGFSSGYSSAACVGGG